MHIDEEVIKAIESASAMVGIDPILLAAIGYQESTLKMELPDASGKGKAVRSYSKVRGIYQITGNTWTAINGKVAYDTGLYPQTITAAKLVAKLQQIYGRRLDSPDLDLVLIGYNGGTGVADRLRGKPITLQTVDWALDPWKGQDGFGPNKKYEVYNYPIKVKQWYNQISQSHVFNVSGGSVFNSLNFAKAFENPLAKPPVSWNDVVNSYQENQEYGEDKSFFIRLMLGSTNNVNLISEVSEKTNYSKSKLVINIRTGLANLKKNGKAG
jgi:hypothetical protein